MNLQDHSLLPHPTNLICLQFYRVPWGVLEGPYYSQGWCVMPIEMVGGALRIVGPPLKLCWALRAPCMHGPY